MVSQNSVQSPIFLPRVYYKTVWFAGARRNFRWHRIEHFRGFKLSPEATLKLMWETFSQPFTCSRTLKEKSLNRNGCYIPTFDLVRNPEARFVEKKNRASAFSPEFNYTDCIMWFLPDCPISLGVSLVLVHITRLYLSGQPFGSFRSVCLVLVWPTFRAFLRLWTVST